MSGPARDEVARIAAKVAAEELRLAASDARGKLANSLARASFRRRDDISDTGEGWRGALTFHPAGDENAVPRVTVIDVVIPDDFPFAPPKLYPGSRRWAEYVTRRVYGDRYHEAGRGWHRELDLAMCLFDEADHTRLPWADGDALLDQARAWLESDATEWTDDQPALDLERYLLPSQETRVVLYGPLHGLDGTVLRLQPAANRVLRLSRRPAGQRRSGSRSGHRRWGPEAILFLDAGALTGPIRDWDDLCAAVGDDGAQQLTRHQQAGLSRVLVTYTRRDVSAALAVELLAPRRGAVTLRALRSAPDDRATRSIRSGPEAAALADRRVAIVGVGAIGSVTADLLHRSGVGAVHVIDSDTVLPGNTTRHLLGDGAIGIPKARAVAEALNAARPLLGRVTFTVERVDTLAQAVELLAAFDVVVDATADSTATAMLTAAARAGAGQLLSACVLADGYAVRVDRLPTADGQPQLPAPRLPTAGPTVYEAGCGSPVSTTPPAAAWEAAALAARHTLGLLTNPESVPAGEQRRVTFPGGDQ